MNDLLIDIDFLSWALFIHLESRLSKPGSLPSVPSILRDLLCDLLISWFCAGQTAGCGICIFTGLADISAVLAIYRFSAFEHLHLNFLTVYVEEELPAQYIDPYQLCRLCISDP